MSSSVACTYCMHAYTHFTYKKHPVVIHGNVDMQLTNTQKPAKGNLSLGFRFSLLTIQTLNWHLVISQESL